MYLYSYKQWIPYNAKSALYKITLCILSSTGYIHTSSDITGKWGGIGEIGWFYKETSDKIVIVSYMKINVSTSMIAYASRNRRLFKIRISIAERITI